MLKPAQKDTYSGQWKLCLSKSPQHLNHLHECHLSLQQQQINCKVAQTLAENRVCSLFQPLSPRQSISSDLLHTSFRPGEDDPRGSSWSIAEHLWVVVYNMRVTRVKTRLGMSASFHCTTGRCRLLHTVCQHLSKHDKTVLSWPENGVISLSAPQNYYTGKLLVSGVWVHVVVQSQYLLHIQQCGWCNLELNN